MKTTIKGRRVALLAGGVALATLLHTPIFAQTTSFQAGDQAQQRENDAAASSAMGDIVVTARRRAESLAVVPIAITAVTGKTLKEQNVVEFKDLQKITPSLTLFTSNVSPSNLAVGMRGQGVAEVLITVDPSIGYYLNGVSLPNFNGAGMAAFIDIEHVEVLKGPQGTLYGRNTTGGSINVFTNKPVDKFEAEVSGSIGNYNNAQIYAMLNLPLQADSVLLRVNGQYETRSAFGRNLFTGRGLGGDLNNTYLRGSLKLTPSDALTVDIFADYAYTSTTGNPWVQRGILITPPASASGAALIQRQTGVATLAQAASLYMFRPENANFWDTFSNLDNGLPLHRENYSYSRSRNINVIGTINWEVIDQLSIKSNTGYRRDMRQSYYDFDGSPYDILTIYSPLHSQSFNQEFQISGELNDSRLNYVAGVYYSKLSGTDGTVNRALVPLNPAVPNVTEGRPDNKSYAAYAQVSYKLTDTLSASGGLRYTKDKRKLTSVNRSGPGGVNCNVPISLREPNGCSGKFGISFNNTSYTLSAEYKPTSDILVFARTATGYRSGGFNIRGTSVQALQPFRPEKVTDYELGLKLKTLGGALDIALDAYHSLYDDIQRSILVPVTTGAGITQVVQNAAKGKVDGIEAQVRLSPSRDFSLSMSGAYTRARYSSYVDGSGNDLSNQPFPYTPKWQYSIGATYHVLPEATASIDWSWRSRVAYTPESLFNGANGLPDLRGQAAYGLLGGRIVYRPESTGLEIAVWGRNLLNRKFFVSGFAGETSFGINSGVVGAPRTFGVTFTKRFG